MLDHATKVDPDLPDEFQAEARSEYEAYAAKLESISTSVAALRQEAIQGRKSSGIEDVWLEDAEAYEGIDDANRAQAKIVKPNNIQGGLQRVPPVATNRSTVFLRITTQYVDSAAARVADMLLPTDDRAFEIKPEPIPELTDLKGDTTPLLDGATGEPMLRPPEDGEQPAAVGPQGPVVPVTKGDKAQEEMDEAKTSAEAAQRRIDDWLVQCQYHAEKRKAIHDRAKLGVSVMKGPFPVKRKARAVSRKDGAVTMEVLESIDPASRRIDPWNFYPDPACGENIHNGNFTFEVDHLTDKGLKALKGVPGYIDSQIEECLKEGPQKSNLEAEKPKRDGEHADKTLYEIWYFYGELKYADLQTCGCPALPENQDGEKTFPAIVTMVNDRVIKAALNPLDDGEFPYDATPWQARAGHWAGIGVARQVREPQGIVNAAWRNMLDNAALSGGPILAVNRSMLQAPAATGFVLSPRMIFTTKDDAEENWDISKAIHCFQIDSHQPELMEIYKAALDAAERTTGLPMLLQGQTGAAPDTLGGQLLANNNASTVLRRIARLDDDNDTEPHIRRYYAWLMLYGEDDEEKGNFTIDARGSSALVERDIQNHATVQMLALSTNPAFGVDPKKAYAEACKAQRLDPKKFQYSEEELAKMAQQPPAPPESVQVAKIGADSRIAVAKIQVTHDANMAANDAGKPDAPDTSVQVAEIRSQTELRKAQMSAEQELQALAMKRDMMLMQFAQDRNMQLNDVKAELAKAGMTLQVQERLADKSTATALYQHHNPTPEVAEPLAEPPGRAEPGEAFSQ